MNFIWRDYHPESMVYVEDWLDESAVRSTGLEDGFRVFYEYWANEDGFVVGKSFWSKVVFDNDRPLAVIAFCQHEEITLIMEIVVKPEMRGQGIGTEILKEFLESNVIMGFAVQKSEAVVYSDNSASQRAFEKAGFQYHHTHEDGDAVFYIYERGIRC